MPFSPPGFGLEPIASAFLTKVNCEPAIPTPTPKPERFKNARRSMVGMMLSRPLAKCCTRCCEEADRLDDLRVRFIVAVP